MNHWRALRLSTDASLIIFLIVVVGVVVWTTDTALGWNLLPDWIDRYAELIVIVLGILAAFAVVTSITCSLAVMAQSAAEQAGLTAPEPSRRLRLLIASAIVLMFGVMFGLHLLDDYRAGKRAEEIQAGMPAILALFSPELRQRLSCIPTQEVDETIAGLLRAIRVSTLFKPSVSVLVTAEAPYTHCVITAAREFKTGDRRHLERQSLTGFPSDWEREAVASGFAGNEMNVPANSRGVFFNTAQPSGWGTLADGDRIHGIVMLRGTK